MHVGSNLARKNREGVLRVLQALLAKGWDGRFVFVGEKLSEALYQFAGELGVRDRVIDIGAVDHETLNALYAGAVALLFPSYSEGFGWPVLEAHASGCPVICTNTTSVPEIAGSAAMQFDPDDAEGMAGAVLRVGDEVMRARFVEEGLANVQRFTMERFVEGYLQLYGEMLDTRVKGALCA
jgi:glycosyltransferase involved in cell wall biosynthesis